MDRPIIYTQENIRGYDIAKGWQDALKDAGKEAQGILGGTTTVAAGLVATPTSPASLSVNIGTGSIFEISTLDSSAAGDLPVDGGSYFMQGVLWSTQAVALSTSALASGQSQYALIQATFGFVDVVRAGDPNAGVLPFYNSANPSVPLQGQGGSGAVLNTERTATVVLSVVYGTPATTGSEVPPNAAANNIGLYLIDLTYGQTTIVAGNILVAGPSVGTGVPSNYPYAPFLAGLLNSHHSGNPGQAPKIQLAAEVQGILPTGNLPFTVLSGSFQATLTGFTAAVTTNVFWQQIGSMVMWKIGLATGTSNSTAFGMTGVPAALLPATSTVVPMGYTFEDNGSSVYGDVSFGDGGGQPVFTKAGSTLWTASGTKGIAANVNICYSLFTSF
ncbi:MAG: hypothetical protein M0Z84_09645 [Gammaproteobacteria bacterium]|nr:hypothetical protein [Gammaproteobacteria bacterium]